VIVVDDGSPDDVAGAIAPYCGRVLLERQPHSGLSAARNCGLRVAQGTLIKFLDADDWLLPDGLRAQAALLDNQNSSLFAVSGYRIEQAESDLPAEDFVPCFASLRSVLCWHNPAPVHAYLFPAALLRPLGGFDESERTRGGHEDYELLTRLASRGAECIIWPGIGCVYWLNPDGMSRRENVMYRTRLAVWLSYAESVLRTPPSLHLLTDLLGGLTKMLWHGEIRYECLEPMERLVQEFELRQPQADTRSRFLISLFASVAALHLPEPVSDQEQKGREKAKCQISRLLDLYPSGPLSLETGGLFLRESPTAFTSMGTALLMDGENRRMQARMQEAESTAAASQQEAIASRQAAAASQQAAIASQQAAVASRLAALVLDLVLKALAGEARRLMVYGTGKMGRAFLRRVAKMNIEVVAVADGNRGAQGRIVEGFKVETLEKGLRHNPDTVVLASVTYAKEMDHALNAACSSMGIYPRIVRSGSWEDPI
jgi:hypothetical protein